MMTIIPKQGTIIYYTGEHETVNGVWQQLHIHGIRIQEVNVELTFKPLDTSIPLHVVQRKYSRFRLDNGREFMEYEDKNWNWFSGFWPEAPSCCKEAYKKYVEPDAVKLNMEIEAK